MQNNPNCGNILVTQEGKIVCPSCGRPTQTRVRETTVLKDFPLYCKLCRRENLITLDMCQSRCARAR